MLQAPELNTLFAGNGEKRSAKMAIFDLPDP